MVKTIPVVGMACAGCAANVERHLRQLEGISEANVNFAARTALVNYNPDQISLNDMKEAILKAGFDLVVEEDRSVEEIEKNSFRLLLRRVIVSWLLALLAMSISMGWLPLGNDNTRNQTLFIIALANRGERNYREKQSCPYPHGREQPKMKQSFIFQTTIYIAKQMKKTFLQNEK